MSAPIQTSIVEGRTVRFVECGDAAATKVLVLVHAFPVGVRLFEPQCGAFPDWRLLAPALPGFDQSDVLDEGHVDACAGHLLAWLDERGIRRAVFGGVSVGGHVVFAVLRMALERVAGVIIANTRSTADSAEARAGRQRMLQSVRDQGTAAIVPDMLARLLGPTSHNTRQGVVSNVRRMIEAQSPEAIEATLRVLMSRPDATPLLSAIQVPALVIAGDEDVLAPPAEMQRMAAAMPAARFVTIPGTGHLPNLEDPDAFNGAVATWLDDAAQI